MHKQLYQLVEEWQGSGNAAKLFDDAYEMLRHLPDFGYASSVCRAAWYYLLPAQNADEQRDAYHDFKEKLKRANDALDLLGVHASYAFNTTGFYPHGYTEGYVANVYGWNGNQIFVSDADVRDDESVLRETGTRETCRAAAIPFITLVKLVLILAENAVEHQRAED